MNAYLGVGIQIITAIILGGLIGIERERKFKPAGIRTNLLICLGATLYTAVAMVGHRNGAGVIDPSRMAAQVVSGVGFLGAGAVLHGRGSVMGLTTAATIWVVAAIGVAIGMGYPVMATIFTITILVVLKSLGPLYNFIEKQSMYHMEIMINRDVTKDIQQLLKLNALEIKDIQEDSVEGFPKKKILHIYISSNPKKLAIVSKQLEEILHVEMVRYHISES